MKRREDGKRVFVRLEMMVDLSGRSFDDPVDGMSVSVLDTLHILHVVVLVGDHSFV